MKFPATLTPDEVAGGFVVTFRDVPEAITQGETIEEALKMAKEALETALEFYTDNGQIVPTPSAFKPGDFCIELTKTNP